MFSFSCPSVFAVPAPRDPFISERKGNSSAAGTVTGVGYLVDYPSALLGTARHKVQCTRLFLRLVFSCIKFDFCNERPILKQNISSSARSIKIIAYYIDIIRSRITARTSESKKNPVLYSIVRLKKAGTLLDILGFF